MIGLKNNAASCLKILYKSFKKKEMVFNRIMSFGSSATVIKPESLRKKNQSGMSKNGGKILNL